MAMLQSSFLLTVMYSLVIVKDALRTAKIRCFASDSVATFKTLVTQRMSDESPVLAFAGISLNNDQKELQGMCIVLADIHIQVSQAFSALTFTDYGIVSPGAVINLAVAVYAVEAIAWRISPADMEDATLGVAAGGVIHQRIVRSPLPHTAYDDRNPTSFHITLLNAAHMQELVGTAPSLTPDSQSVHRDPKPLLSLFRHGTQPHDAILPIANNITDPQRHLLASVQSVAAMESQWPRYSGEQCGWCHELAAVSMECGHLACDICCQGLPDGSCFVEGCQGKPSWMGRTLSKFSL